ncbi:MAG: ATP-binding protein, partial [Candidatus Micrarchaeia archaeon]
FSKRAKLSRLDYLFIVLFLIGVFYLEISLNFMPLSAVYGVAALYLVFFLSLEFKNTKGKIYQSAIAKEERRYSSISSRTETAPKVCKTYKKPVDFNSYIAKATNHNLFVAGSSGTGKTTLMRYMIGLFPNSAKTIFSFKANDDYLKLGIPILKVAEYAGDPFADKEAFVQAFLVAYPISSQGVVAASLPNLLRTLAKKSDLWKAFRQNIEEAMKKEKPSSITHSAYSFIYQKLADLELSSIPCPIDYDKSIVLDFSGLNETAKSFYAELYLRQVWSHIEAGKDSSVGHIIVIDEAHRLLKSEATIFGETARLIRSKGALWCGTQNYTDLPDYISNQFATHLLFGTRSESDLRALKEINSLLPFVATEMPEHHFTDAASRELHTAIPLYIAYIRNFKDYSEAYIKPEPSYAKK